MALASTVGSAQTLGLTGNAKPSVAQLSSAKPSSSQSHMGASRLGSAAAGEVTRSRRLRRYPQSLRQFLEVLAVRYEGEAAPQSVHRWRDCEHKHSSAIALTVRHAVWPRLCKLLPLARLANPSGTGQSSGANALHSSPSLRLHSTVLHHQVRPNPSLKRDCHRQGSWPASRSLPSFASRAKPLTGVSPSAQTLAIANRHCDLLRKMHDHGKSRNVAMKYWIYTFALVSLAGCASGAKNIDYDIDISVPDALTPALATHLPTTPLAAELAALDSSIAIDHKGNLGHIATSEKQAAFHWQPNGRLSITSVSIYKAPNGSNSISTTTAVTLCGLVPLVTESSIKSTSQLTTAVIAGSSFIPLNFSSKGQLTTRFHTTQFSASVTNLCKLEPGSTFSFRTEGELQRKYEGNLFSANKLRTTIESATCTTSSTERSAAALDPGMRGGYLEVTCSYAEPDKPVRKSIFAFLLASGLYVPITEQLNEYETDSSRYTAPRYK